MPIQKSSGRKRRQLRIRSHITGTAERPRLCIFISNLHIYAQIVNDLEGNTLVFASSLSKELRGLKPNKKTAAEVGKKVAEIAKERNITQVVFDRAGYRYTGKIKSLADAAHEAGLKF